MGSDKFTWADLLFRKLAAVRVYVLYFPSRFDLELDNGVRSALETFGRGTPAHTSVNFWDPTDPEFSRALGIFDVGSPPALVLATGLSDREIATRSGGDDWPGLYAITIAEPQVLRDREQLAGAVNRAYEVLVRGNPDEITGHVRSRTVEGVVAAIGRVLGGVRDELVKCKPKFGLPGGISVQLG